MKILHVLAPGKFGGLETVVRGLATGLKARGEDVMVAPMLEAGGDEPALMAGLRAADVPIYPIVLPPHSYWAQARELARTIARTNPDIVHSHGYVADVIVGLLRRNMTVATTTTVHGFTGGGRKNRAYEWLQIRSLRRFDAVVAVSSTIHSRLVASGITPHRVHLIRNAWGPSSVMLTRHEARHVLGIPTEAAAIGWVGRISREKGLDVFVSALGELVDLSFRAIVIGDGRERQAVERVAADRGVAARITWVGSVADAARLMRAFDVFALSSRTEGTPMTVLEAMHASVPIVATAVGGVPDVIGSANGWLVAPESKDALAAALREALTHPAEAAARAASAATRLANEFSPDTWLDRYDQLYHAVARERSASHRRLMPNDHTRSQR